MLHKDIEVASQRGDDQWFGQNTIVCIIIHPQTVVIYCSAIDDRNVESQTGVFGHSKEMFGTGVNMPSARIYRGSPQGHFRSERINSRVGLCNYAPALCLRGGADEYAY